MKIVTSVSLDWHTNKEATVQFRRDETQLAIKMQRMKNHSIKLS